MVAELIALNNLKALNFCSFTQVSSVTNSEGSNFSFINNIQDTTEALQIAIRKGYFDIVQELEKVLDNVAAADEMQQLQPPMQLGFLMEMPPPPSDSYPPKVASEDGKKLLAALERGEVNYAKYLIKRCKGRIGDNLYCFRDQIEEFLFHQSEQVINLLH